MSHVQLVCVASKTHIGVELQDVLTQAPIKIVGIRPNPEGTAVASSTVRSLIEEVAADVAGEYAPVAPARFKFSFPTTQASGLGDTSLGRRDALTDEFIEGYCCFQHRNTLPVENTEASASTGKPIASIEAALNMRFTTKGGQRDMRGGKPTKAYLVRENVIRPGLAAGKTPEQMVAEIVKDYGFKLPLAREYFKENLRKVMA